MLRLHQIFILATLYLNFGLFEGLPITNDTQREILRKLYQRLRVDVEDFGLALNFTNNESEMRLGTSSDGWSFRKVVDAIVGRKEEEAQQVKKNGVSETINDIIHNLNEVREMVEGSNCTGGEPEPHASEETDEHEDDHEDEHEDDHEEEHEVDSHEEESHEDEEHSEEDSHSGSEEESEEHHQPGTEISTHGSEEAAVEITTATEGSSESLTTTEWPFRATFHEIGAHLGLLKIVPRPAATDEEAASTTESAMTTAIYDFVDKIKSSLGYKSNTSEENKSDSSAEQINSPSDVVLSTEEPVESETNVAAELEGAAEMTTAVSETESEGHSNDQHVTSARGGTAGEENHSTSDELTQGSDSPGENSKEIALPAIDVAGQEDENYEIQEAATSETPALESIDPDQLGNEQASSRLSMSIEDSKNDAENQSSKDIEAINVNLGGEISVTDVPDSSTMSSNAAIDDSLKISDSPEILDQSTETAGKSLKKEISDEEIAEKSKEENTAGKSADEETTTEISAVNSSDQDDIKSMSQENKKQISPQEALPEDSSVTTVPTDSSDDGSSEIGVELETIVEETESDMERENKMNNFMGEILTPEIIQAEIERAAQQKTKESGEEDKNAENEADLINSGKEDNFSGEILTPEIILAEKERAAQEKVNQSVDDSAKRDEILETKSDANNVEQNKFTTETIPPAGEDDKIEAANAESYGGRDINDDLILVEADDEQTSTAEPKFTTEMPPEEVDDISTDLNSRRVITHSEEMEYLEKTQTQEKGSYSDEIEETIYGSAVVVNETVPERVKDVFEELLEMQKAQETENATDNKSTESTFGKISTWIEEKLDETHEQSKNDSDDGIFGGIISEVSSVAEKAKDAIDELFEMKKSHEEEKASQNSAERETEAGQGAYDSFFIKLITDAEKSQEEISTPTSELTDQSENAESENIATHAPVQHGSEELKTEHGIEKEEALSSKKQEEDKILSGSGEIPKSEEGGGFGSWFKQVNEALQNENQAQETTKMPVDFDDRSKEIKIAPRTGKDDESTQKEDIPTKQGEEDESVKEPNESASKSEGGFGTWFKHVNEALQNENQANAEEGSSNASVKQDGSEAGEVKLSNETENDVVRSDNESVGSETKEPNKSANKSEGGGFGTWFKHVNEALQNEKGTEEESTSTHTTQDGSESSTESGKQAEILGSISEEKDEVNISGKQEKDTTGHSDSSKSENKSEGGFGTWFKHVNEALQNENQDKKEEESSNTSVKQDGSEAEDAKLSNEAENDEEKSDSEMHLAKGEEEQSAGSGTKEPNEIAGKREGSGFGTWFKHVNKALQNEKDADEESIHGQSKETKSSNETGKEMGILESRSEEKDLLNVIGKEESEHSDKTKSENKSEGGFGSWFKHVAETLENETKSIIEKLDSGEREHAEKTSEAPSSVETTQASILEESEEKSSVLSAITAGVDSAVDKVSSWFGEKLHEKEESSEPEGGSGLGGKISAAEKAYERESETEEQTLEKDKEVVAGTTEIGKGEKSKVTSADTKETSSSEDKKLTVDFATDVIHSAEKESEDKVEKSDKAKENAPVKLGDDSADTDNKAAVIPDTKSNENENIPTYDEISAGNVPDATKESDDVESENEENIDQADTEDEIELAPAPAEKDDSNEGGLIPQVESGEKTEEHTPEHVPEYESPTIELEQTDLDDYNEPFIDVGKLEEEEETPAGGTEMKQPIVAETENVKYEHNLSSNLISPGTDRVEPSMLSMKQFHDNKGNPEPRVNVTFNAPKDKGVYDMYIDRKGRRCSEFTELPLDVEYLREVFVNFGFSNFQLPSLGVNLNELADKAVFFKDLDDNSILCGTLTINHR
ncbi:serine-rich adhesin for platelets-like [Cloeon dipterum]|uniref:serine-rich adhesin for platelets-like n=1 Tax=Cloeon dipterum TaxID=197152 RepID=UPI0032201336